MPQVIRHVSKGTTVTIQLDSSILLAQYVPRNEYEQLLTEVKEIKNKLTIGETEGILSFLL